MFEFSFAYEKNFEQIHIGDIESALALNPSDCRLAAGDCLTVLRTLPDACVDSVVTDPPYHLTSIVKRFGAENAAPAKVGKTGAFARASRGFMGKVWDGGDIAFQVELWAEVLRVLKPGGHMVAFGGTRTYHRTVCAIEDAGFEVRDQLAWVYGQGFPKNHDVSKGIDKAGDTERLAGGVPDLTAPNTDAARQWEGWGTALKPAFEPICLARKPLSEGTVAANVLRWGTGAINVNACRIKGVANDLGRWPANFLHDGSDEVLVAFPQSAGQQGDLKATGRARPTKTCLGDMAPPVPHAARNDTGSAARFFYCAKAPKADRAGSKHPTVKPLALIGHLARLITPPGGLVLDIFAGSGTTGQAARDEGFRSLLIEREAEYVRDIERRLAITAYGS